MRTTSRSAHQHARTRARCPRRLPAVALLAAALALAGCGAGSGDSGAAGDKAAASGAEAQRQGAAGSGAAKGDAAGAGTASKAPKLTAGSIIRTASLTVRVKDVPKALGTARTAAEDAGGYVGDETTRRDAEGHEHTRVVLRVPAGKYDEVLGDLQGTGVLLHRTAKAEDVTDQVVDVDSRVKSQRASVARIRELMDRADKLGDVVALEGELSSREADLEALLAQQASLKDRVGLATITLSLTGAPAAAKKAAGDDGPGFLDALAGGWDVFLTLLRWIALAVGALLPFAAVIALGALVWTRLVRPRLPRRPAPVAATSPGTLPTAPPAPADGD
ncbi:MULTISPECIES: DUF4349 domain-containing protein [unclassified Streptomyces]|uniref:DUF4349 domain-containing protein n=1 Tax=unclassified Streptomyces TaxID=2593676 RepID=UPI0004C06D05|nr:MULTISPECIES: DUF4349 domain-containing protein [unclassified Streptomyces]